FASHVKQNYSEVKFQLYFVRKISNLIESMNRSQMKRSTIHKVRIELKEFFYNLIFINNCVLKNKLVENHIQGLHHFQDEIGKWHDQVSMYKLTARQDKQVSKKEKESMKFLHQKLHGLMDSKTNKLKKEFRS